MYRILSASKDAYITSKVISGDRKYNSNTGQCGTLDLYKIYGASSSGSTPNTELSRLLIKFDISEIRTLLSQGKIDISNPSFEARVKLKDVYGGQTTPIDFTVALYPLSKSFDEGLGKDVVYLSDEDVVNFLTASRAGGLWHVSGCSLSSSSDTICDYITSSNGVSMKASQYFVTGEEDFDVDVTQILSATLTNQIPDQGFRIALEENLERDSLTYFVKRFSSRHAYDYTNRPELIVKFDDSIQDDSQLITFDNDYTIFLFNYSKGQQKNLVSASTQISGDNSLILKMSIPVSGVTGGWYNLYFTGSQHKIGSNPVTGIYSASIHISSSISHIKTKINQSGSFYVTPIWSSFDDSVTYLTGSKLLISQFAASEKNLGSNKYDISVYGISNEIDSTEDVFVRVHLFDKNSNVVKHTKVPLEMPGVVLRDVFYSIRNVDTNKVVIPFDGVKNSTRLSSDSSGMWFLLHTANLQIDQRYVIDIKIVSNGVETLYKSASPIFKVTKM